MHSATLIAGKANNSPFFQPINFEHTPITCNVHFGVPGGQGDCIQIGICRVIIDETPNPSTLAKENRRCRQAAAQITPNADGGIDMFFPEEGIMPCTERAIFRNAWFPVPVAHELPGEISNRFENTRRVIAAGRYPVIRVSGGYVISF